MKKIVRSLLRATMAGKTDGLSAFGRGAERLANHLLFQANRLRAEHLFSHAPRERTAGWTEDLTGRLVYDFGANHGRNIPYYLANGLHVIAVEANPLLCDLLNQKFAVEIAAARVIVVNACITPEETEDVAFYAHKQNDLLSTFVAPESDAEADFDRITVTSETPRRLFVRYGQSFFVKIDLEGLDGPIIRSIGSAAPAYISAEAHNLSVFIELLRLGYSEFKVVEGSFSHGKYYEVAPNGHPYRFEQHSAGPFGEDIPGTWENAEATMSYLTKRGLGYGWKDVHGRLGNNRYDLH
jgi:FkbM family methyltransferase